MKDFFLVCNICYKKRRDAYKCNIHYFEVDRVFLFQCFTCGYEERIEALILKDKPTETEIDLAKEKKELQKELREIKIDKVINYKIN